MLIQKLSQKIFNNLIATFVFSSGFWDIGVQYFAFCLLLWQFDESSTTQVEIRIFPIPIAYWLGLGYSRNNPDPPPPPPYGWQAGNPDGRGGQEGLEIRVGLGYRLENSSGVIFDV